MTRVKKSITCLLSIFTRSQEKEERNKRNKKRPISIKRSIPVMKRKKMVLMSLTLERIAIQITSK
jgi:hypothetical protein